MAVIAKARVAQLNGFSPITAPAELSVAFGDCFYRWKARLLGGWGSSSAQGIGGRVRAPAPTQMQELSLLFVGAGPRPARGRPHGAAPTKYGELSGLSVGADDLGGLRAHTVRPYGGKRTGSVGSAGSGAAVERHQGQILQTQGPVARREFRASLRFCAPEILLGLAGMRLLPLRGNSPSRALRKEESLLATRRRRNSLRIEIQKENLRWRARPHTGL